MTDGFWQSVRERFSGHADYEVTSLREQLQQEEYKTQRLCRWIRLYMQSEDPTEYRSTLSAMANEYYDEDWVKRNGRELSETSVQQQRAW